MKRAAPHRILLMAVAVLLASAAVPVESGDCRARPTIVDPDRGDPFAPFLHPFWADIAEGDGDELNSDGWVTASCERARFASAGESRWLDPCPNALSERSRPMLPFPRGPPGCRFRCQVLD